MQSERTGGVPADIQRILDDIERAGSVATALIRGLSDEQFNWRPDGGTRWSVGQCLEHLAITNELYGAAIRSAVEQASRSGFHTPWRAETWFLRAEVRQQPRTAGEAARTRAVAGEPELDAQP